MGHLGEPLWVPSLQYQYTTVPKPVRARSQAAAEGLQPEQDRASPERMGSRAMHRAHREPTFPAMTCREHLIIHRGHDPFPEAKTWAWWPSEARPLWVTALPSADGS